MGAVNGAHTDLAVMMYAGCRDGDRLHLGEILAQPMAARPATEIPQIGSRGNFLRVAAEFWGHGVARNVEE